VVLILSIFDPLGSRYTCKFFFLVVLGSGTVCFGIERNVENNKNKGRPILLLSEYYNNYL
jgi:hypothetical protein